MSNFKVGDKVWVLCHLREVLPDRTCKVEGSQGACFWTAINACRPVEPVIKDSLTTESNCPEIPDSSSEPWTPKVGERVRLIETGHIYEIESYSETYAQYSMQGWPGSCVNLEDIEPVNRPKIPNSSSEPMRKAFEANLIQQMGWNQGYFGRNENRYFDSQIEMSWQAFQAGAKYGNPSGRWEPTKDEIEYAMDRCGVPISDPIKVGDTVVVVTRSHKWRGVHGKVVSISESNEYPLEFISDCGKRLGYFRLSSLKRIDKSDPINPAHYKQGDIECIEAIKAALGDGFPDYLRGNVMKYLWRYKEKGGVDDLRKSAWYLDRLIKEVGE